jgi:membrane protein
VNVAAAFACLPRPLFFAIFADMARLIPSSAKRSYEFISDKLWKVRMNKVEGRQGILIRQLRVFSLAGKGFDEDNCFTTGSALTFFTLFSIVPILALVFAIAKGFGYEKDIEIQLMHSYSEYSEVLGNAFIYANSMLDNAKGGVIAGIGIVLLLWSVMKLLVNIENAFNRIWEVQKGRSWLRKTTDYLTIMILAPVVLILSIGITVAIETKTGELAIIGELTAVFLKLFSYALLTAIFTFLYVALPNTKVKYKSAITAAVISMVAFELLGWAYIKFQVGANQMNAIYGGFAALPLFLIWVQYSWFIVLFGAQLTYAYQNVAHHELEDEIRKLSVRYRKVIALLIANLVARRFYNGERALNVDEIAAKLDLPSRLARTLINEFVESGILAEVKTENYKEVVYQPGVTESKFTVQYVIDTLEKKGVNTLPIGDSEELAHISKIMNELDLTMDTSLGHVYVKDLVKQ